MWLWEHTPLLQTLDSQKIGSVRGDISKGERGRGEDIIKGRDAEKTTAIDVTSQVSISRAPKRGSGVKNIFLKEVFSFPTCLNM